MSTLHKFDIYRKIPKDLTQPTSSGALISILSILFITFLLYSELLLFMKVETQSELFVEDPVQEVEEIPIFMNISILKMDCKYVGLDIIDELGRHDEGFMEDTQKVPIGVNNVGCRIEAHFAIRKVPGNFHVSTHAAKEQPSYIDFTHVIHELHFGNKMEKGKNVKGSFNPIENVDKSKTKAIDTHDYFLNVVPTVYEDITGDQFHPYQYTYSDHHYSGDNVAGIKPVIWFMYNLSPFTVRYKETRKPFYTFLTTICAIVGGTFTLAGIIDSCVFTAAEVFKKAELGK